MSLLPFAFDDSTVRVVEQDGQAYFVGRDVTEILGYANSRDAMDKHCRGVAKRYPLQTAGGLQELRILSEADVLRLVVRSKLPAAERFERWVFDEVLPQIGRTGGYGMPDLNDPGTLRTLLLGYTAKLEEQAPKVEAFERIADASGALCLTDAAKALQIPRGRFIAWLQEHTWIHKRIGTSWQAYAPRISQGVLVHKVVVRGAGAEERIYGQVLVTPKGLTRLAELLTKDVVH
ncbi:MAG: phage antirepressor KilAC domain-containing protein [Pseudoxanthomonas sp.]